MYKGLCKCHSVGFFILFSRRFTSSIAVTRLPRCRRPCPASLYCSSNRFYQSRASPNPTLLRHNSLSPLELVTLDLSNLSLSNLSLKLKTNLSHVFCSRAHSWEELTRELSARAEHLQVTREGRNSYSHVNIQGSSSAGTSTHVFTPTNSRVARSRVLPYM